MRPWMGISHPNILQLVAVEIKHDTGVVSKMTTNGNILDYNNVNKANRLRLVRSLVVNVSLGRNRQLDPQLEDVANGLERLHRSGVIHGDLKKMH